MNRAIKQRAQNLVEYSMVVAVVIAAVLSMQIYMKRGITAGVKVAVDRLGPQQITINSTMNASTNSFMTEVKTDSTRKQTFTGGEQRRIENSQSSVTGYSESVATQQ